MMPILQRIDQQLQATTREDARAELLAERITYMARIGQFSESHQIVQLLRQKFSDGSFPRVSVWLMIVDGILGFFERLDPKSTDRLLRAHEVARVAGFRDLNRIAASWLVMSGFNTGNYESMARFFERYVESSAQERDSAACRVAVIVTYAEMYAGRFSAARLWFERSRQLAVEVGDEASIASLMYGRAAMHNARARLNEVLGRHEPEVVEFTNLEVDSSESFHRATGQSSLSQCLDLLRARSLVAEQKFDAAAEILRSLVEADVPVSMIGDQLVLKIEHAFCLFRAGRLNEARLAFGSLDVPSVKKLGLDDQVVFWSYFREISLGLGESALGENAQAQLNAAAALYESEIGRLVAVLNSLERPLHDAFAHVPGPKSSMVENQAPVMSQKP